MNHAVQDNVLNARTGLWNRLPTVTKRFELPTHVWLQAILFIVFGLLLLFVIRICTGSSVSPFMPLALMAALVVGVAVMLRPVFAPLLIFIGAGLPSLLLPLPGHTMRPIEPALLLCLLIVILRRSHMRLRLPHLLALLFLAIAIISFIHVPDISTDLNAYAADKRLYEVILTVLSFFCGTFLVKYVKNASSFLVAVLLGNTPLYLIGLAQALGIHLPPLLGHGDPSQLGGRLAGPFGGPADFGLYLVNLFAVALACWILGTSRRDRIIAAIMTIATAFEIIGSGTRSAAIAAIILVIVSFTLTRRFKMLLATLALAATTVAIIFNKILLLFMHDPTSTSNRLFLWQEAIQLIATHPWIGIGLQQFPKYYGQLIVSLGARLDPHGISVHEQYLEWAMESGILWLIVGVLLLLSITYSCWKVYHVAQRRQQILLLATILALLANIVTGFSDVPLDTTEGAVFLFLLAGLALGYAEYIRWGIPGQKMAAHISRSLVPQATSATGIGTGLYPPLSERSRAYPSTPQQSLPSDASTASTTDKAPDAQRTGKTILLRLLSWALAIPATFPATALLTHYLGPTQYGEYSFTLPFLAVFALLSGTGMDPLIIRQLSRQPRAEWRNILSYATGTRLLSTAVSAGVAALLALALPISAEQRVLLLLGSGSLFFSFSFNALRSSFSYGFLAEQRASLIFLLEGTNRVVTAGLVALIVLLHLSLVWAYVLLIYSDLPFFIILAVVAWRRYGMRIRFSLARAREHLLGSLSLTGYDALALLAGQADLLLLMALAGSQAVGIYALAVRLADPLGSIVIAYMLGLYPLLCTKFEEGHEQFAKLYQEATRLVALSIIPLAIFVSVEANAIVTLLGGWRFAAAAIALQLQIWATVAGFLGQLAVRSCMAANKERVIPFVTVASAGVNILANVALIPRWGVVGAGVAALVSEIIGLCLFTVLLRRHIRLLPTIGVLLRVFLASIPALAFLLWQQHASLLIVAPIAFLLIIVGCVATRTLSLKDIQMVRRLLYTRLGKKTSNDVTQQPTVILPRIQDVTDWPTLILPRVQV